MSPSSNQRPPARHLPLIARKLLFARVALLERVEQHVPALARADVVMPVDTLRREILNHTAATHHADLRSAGGSSSLEVHFRNSLAHVETVAIACGAAVNLDGLKISCTDCCAAVRGAAVCAPGQENDLLITVGECLAPFRVLFDYAHAMGRVYYGEKHHLTLSFATHTSSSFPHQLASDIAANGNTEYDDSSGIMHSTVNLVFQHEAFDWPTYLSTLYILSHEVVVHAFQGVDSLYPRVPADGTDVFSEGWMDWISIELLRRSLGSAQLRHVLGEKAQWSREFLEVGTSLHYVRGDIRRAGIKTNEFLAARHFGKEAAIRLNAYFYPEKPGESMLFELSRDLNASAQPGELIDSFVAVVHRYLPRLGEERVHPDAGPLYESLSQYLKDRNALALLRACRDIDELDGRFEP